MSDIKITVEAPGLVEAINALAAAMAGKVPCSSGTVPLGSAPAAPSAAVPAAAPAAAPAAVDVPWAVAQQPIQPAAAIPGGYSAAATTGPQLPVQPAPAAAQAAAATPTIEAIATAGAALCEKGMMAQLVGLLQKYGCQAITQLQPEHIPAFVTELRALGAAI